MSDIRARFIYEALTSAWNWHHAQGGALASWVINGKIRGHDGPWDMSDDNHRMLLAGWAAEYENVVGWNDTELSKAVNESVAEYRTIGWMMT